MLVLAPHPDDDVLGCGALLALAARRGCTVHVLYGTDGAASHPRSRRYPAPVLRDVREAEACEALRRLGHDPGRARFLRAPDGALGELAPAAEQALTAAVEAVVAAVEPTLVLLPWRRDPHPDHRAFAALGRAALSRAALSRALGRSPLGPAEVPAAAFPAPRVLEYPVWLAERGTSGERPQSDEMRTVRFTATTGDAAAKRAALAAHRSQTTGLIDDDPSGFVLDPAMVERICTTPELFYEEP